jgi:hypothetical protein
MGQPARRGRLRPVPVTVDLTKGSEPVEDSVCRARRTTAEFARSRSLFPAFVRSCSGETSESRESAHGSPGGVIEPMLELSLSLRLATGNNQLYSQRR